MRSLTGVIVVGGIAAGALFFSTASGSAAPPKTAADEQSSLEEDYGYPGADRIFAERGIRLIKGDGHILLDTCVPGGAGQMAVSSSAFNDAICFKVTGATGSLTVSIPEVFSVKGDGHSGSATWSTGGAPQTTPLLKEFWNPINMGDGGTLLELKAWT